MLRPLGLKAGGVLAYCNEKMCAVKGRRVHTKRKRRDVGGLETWCKELGLRREEEGFK